MLKDLILYYQQKHQSVPLPYPGSGGIEELFEYLSVAGIKPDTIRELIMQAIDSKFGSYHPFYGFGTELKNKHIQHFVNLEYAKKGRLRAACNASVKRAVKYSSK